MEELINKLIVTLGMPGLITAVALGLEMLFRLVKTDKPKSILYAIAGGAHLIAAGLEKVGVFLDSVLPQRLNKP